MSALDDCGNLSFEDLPSEIRNEVYHYCLVSPHPIVVWSAPEEHDTDEFGGRPVKRDRAATTRSLECVYTSLLHTTRLLAREAAFIFYSRNAFSFSGPHEWLKVIDWLQQIGDNKFSLTQFDLYVRRLSRAYQWSNGTLEFVADGYIESVFPRHPLLGQPEEPAPAGFVEDINPEIETIFKFLGSREDALPMTVNLSVAPGYMPAAALPLYHTDFEDDWAYDYPPEHFTLDLPNLVEAWRAAHGSGPGRRSIDVIWTCREPCKSVHTERTNGRFDEHGWEVLSLDKEVDNEYAAKWPDSRPLMITTLKLRKRPHHGPILAEPPCPEWEHNPPSVWSAHLEEEEEREQKRRALMTWEGAFTLRMQAEVVNNRSILDYFSKVDNSAQH